jgi:RNA polymerase sigma-32 factor
MRVARRRRPEVNEDVGQAAERIALLLQWRAGDPAAGDLLVSAYFSVVDALASRWRRGSIPKSELVQEGQVGLLEALRRYDDATAKMPLSAYVSKWIECRIKQHVMNFSGPVRLTDRAARRDYFAIPNGRPTAAPVDESMPCLDDGPEELTIQTLMDEHRRDIVERCLELLSERERDIIRRRALAAEPQKLAEIAAERGIARQTVHGLEARAMEKMREAVSGLFGMRVEWLV